MSAAFIAQTLHSSAARRTLPGLKAILLLWRAASVQA